VLSKTLSDSAASGELQGGRVWFDRSGDPSGDVWTLGLTDLGVEEVGLVQNIDFPTEVGVCDSGDTLLTIEGTRGSLEVLAPCEGAIQAMNLEIRNQPELLQDDPLEEGWLIRLQSDEVEDEESEEEADEDESDDYDGDDDEALEELA
jgi:glycine cleavage system H protein